MKHLLGLVMVLAAAGCGGGTTSPTSLLTGIVTRGPVTPVCIPDIPCYAPFSARFVVSAGGRAVAAFRSGTDGRYSIALWPGRYVITPDSDAPVISPGIQSREVVVGDMVTTVDMVFDTGIR